MRSKSPWKQAEHGPNVGKSMRPRESSWAKDLVWRRSGFFPPGLSLAFCPLESQAFFVWLILWLIAPSPTHLPLTADTDTDTDWLILNLVLLLILILSMAVGNRSDQWLSMIISAPRPARRFPLGQSFSTSLPMTGARHYRLVSKTFCICTCGRNLSSLEASVWVTLSSLMECVTFSSPNLIEFQLLQSVYFLGSMPKKLCVSHTHTTCGLWYIKDETSICSECRRAGPWLHLGSYEQYHLWLLERWGQQGEIAMPPACPSPVAHEEGTILGFSFPPCKCTLSHHAMTWKMVVQLRHSATAIGDHDSWLMTHHWQ